MPITASPRRRAAGWVLTPPMPPIAGAPVVLRVASKTPTYDAARHRHRERESTARPPTIDRGGRGTRSPRIRRPATDERARERQRPVSEDSRISINSGWHGHVHALDDRGSRTTSPRSKSACRPDVTPAAIRGANAERRRSPPCGAGRDATASPAPHGDAARPKEYYERPERTLHRRCSDDRVAHRSPLCWRSLATIPVQPVWWPAPMPAPLSPWKYS